jgi:hypothetical protein
MKKLLFVTLSLGLLSLGLSMSTDVHAGDAKVTWGDMDKFSDVDSRREMKQDFHERVQKEFGMVFSNLAKKLPTGYQLEVDVTDLDLAGEVRGQSIGFGLDIRVLREIYWPKMSFSYVLKDEKGAVVGSGKEELRDMNYLHNIRMPTGNTSFEYEEKMLQDWFRHQQRDNHFPKMTTKSEKAD